MKIVMVAHSYYLRDPRIMREAQALFEAGHQVDVLCLRDLNEPQEEVVAGIRVVRLPVQRRRGGALRYLQEYWSFTFLAAAWLLRRVRKERYDLVHVHNMPNFLVLAGLVPKAMGAALILDVHDPMPELFGTDTAHSHSRWIVPILRFEEVASCRLADRVITVSEPMRDLLADRGTPAGRISVVMNLPDSRLFEDAAPSSSTDDELHTDGFTLVYAGTVSERYGLDLAIEGVAALRDEMPDLHLVIAGDGPQLPGLQELAARLGVVSRVQFLGSLPLNEVSRLLVRCDVGISCHRNGPFGELAFSNKILECLEAGLPVISSRTRTVEHYLGDSMLFFFEPGDVLELVEQVRKVRQEPALVATKKAEARRKLQELRWDSEKTKLVELVGALAK
ncbi:MAG TPA: glycosyltransferase family 4 protein [Actinomycetota bacterium]|nr:glycosyltransferase family 4 protein [Actinomycetota bacterium]